LKAKIITIFIFISFLWSLLIFRAAYLQFLPHTKLNALQARQFQTRVTLPARRGTIFDASGKELAMSAPSYSLYADPKIIQDKKKVAEKLSLLIPQNSRDIFNKIKTKDKRFVWIDRHIDASHAEKIRDLKIRGLGFVEDWKRVYPNDSLLGSTLGFLGKEGQALEGLELHYDKALRGENKKMILRRDARGRPLIQDGLLFTESPQGQEIKLTIDADLQYFAESEMAQAIKHHDAEGGWIVILDAKTSAILTLANLPTFDPNNQQRTSAFVRRNRTVTDTFEPGSTLKTFVIADAIDNKIVKPSSKIFCENGHFKIGKRIIREAEKDHAQGTISVNEILAYSSNIGTSKIALMMGDNKLQAGLLAFGFGAKSGADLPGEAKGITLKLPWNDHLLANISFGQGITATPLQLANAYAAIANGGVLNRPYIVESIKDAETGEIEETKVQPIRRVISEETAAKMRLMLAGVTADKGTGIAAQVPGYIVAGKTGTAQKIKSASKGYMKGGYIGSFVGFIPANNPKYVIFIGLDHPKKNGYYGSVVAAPLFSKIASYAVRKSGINPEIPSEINLTKFVVTLDKKTVEDKVISLNYKNSESTELELTQVVPYLKELSQREVIGLVSEAKINVKFVGYGKVESTYPEQGQPLNEAREITVILK